MGRNAAVDQNFELSLLSGHDYHFHRDQIYRFKKISSIEWCRQGYIDFKKWNILFLMPQSNSWCQELFKTLIKLFFIKYFSSSGLKVTLTLHKTSDWRLKSLDQNLLFRIISWITYIKIKAIGFMVYKWIFSARMKIRLISNGLDLDKYYPEHDLE